MAAIDSENRQQFTDPFYVGLAAICALLAFAGFAPTYWLQLPAGTFVGPPLIHFHATLLFAWTLLLLSQAVLADNGRFDYHRAWGLAGIALATVMVLTGVATAIYTLKTSLAAGYGDAARAFMILPLCSIYLFAGFFIAGIVAIHHRHVATHPRLILLATFSLLQVAMGRIFIPIAVGVEPGRRPGLVSPPPVTIGLVLSLILELLIVVATIYDWRKRGWPHPVWIIGAAVITAVNLLRGPIGSTQTWFSIADSLGRIGGWTVCAFAAAAAGERDRIASEPAAQSDS